MTTDTATTSPELSTAERVRLAETTGTRVLVAYKGTMRAGTVVRFYSFTGRLEVALDLVGRERVQKVVTTTPYRVKLA